MSKPRFCVDCKWYKGIRDGRVMLMPLYPHQCTWGKKVTYHLVTGDAIEEFPDFDCREARKKGHHCGPHGKHWEAKDAV